jgi:DNA-binding FadR family transcriptional regulator
MEPLFRATRQSRIFRDVVDQIQDAIIDGRLKTGDKLPAERELKDLLKTSRSTLREALRVLEQKGLIEIKLGVGGGSVVKSVSTDQVTESLDLLIRSQKISLTHLADFREGVEGEVVAIAARRASEEDIRNLERLLNEAKYYADIGASTLDEFLKADKDLHLAFASITHNLVYISVLQTIHNNIYRYYDRYLSMKDREMKENYLDLKAIVEAVKLGRSETARTLARQHVRRFYEYMHQHQAVQESFPKLKESAKDNA